MSSETTGTPLGGEPSPSQELPPAGEPVWVECGTYRTLAYRDAKGVWKSVAKNEPLEVTKILGK